MYVCITDWGQSVIRDEMRFYGWWNVSQNTHRKARMRNNFHWYVNIDFPFIPFQFQFYPLDEHCWGEVLLCASDKYRMWCFWENISLEIKDGIFGFCWGGKLLFNLIFWMWFQRKIIKLTSGCCRPFKFLITVIKPKLHLIFKLFLN